MEILFDVSGPIFHKEGKGEYAVVKSRKLHWPSSCNTATTGCCCKLCALPQPFFPKEKPGCAGCLFITMPGK